MPRTFLPTSDNDLLNWALNFSTLLTANFAAYGASQAMASTYSSKFNIYKTALAAAKSDATRGRSTVAAKRIAKNDLMGYTRLVAGQINRTITVTEQQRIDLGLIVRKKPSPTPAPTKRPTLAVASVTMYQVSLNIYDPASKTKRGKPDQAIGAKVYTYVGAEYPSDPSLWQYDGDATSAKHVITFPNTTPSGSQVWFCAAWYNRKGQTGPVSVPVSTNIQGGGSMAQQQGLKIAA